MRPWPRVAVVVLVAAAALAGLVALGRAEHRHEVSSELRGIARIRKEVGPLDSPSLTGFRLSCRLRADNPCPNSDADCLVYRRGANPLALEICIDPAGRVVAAIDRRGGRLRTWTMQYEEPASTIRVDRRFVDRLLRRMGGYLPVIRYFEPQHGPPGTVITIHGSQLQYTIGFSIADTVKTRTFLEVTPTIVKVAIPQGAVTGTVSVITSSGVTATTDKFVVTRG